MHSLPNLPASVSHEVFASLCDLPPPRIDTPENRAQKYDVAMEAVAALAPHDAFEALLAAEIILADAHAKECMRLAAQDPATAKGNRAQAVAMMRQAQSGLRLLERRQARREKQDAEMHPSAMERAGWWFRDASVPEAPDAPKEPEAAFEELTPAEQYAVLYPDRARLIRAHGGLPDRVSFGRPEADIVAALVSSTSPMLLALDNAPAAAGA